MSIFPQIDIALRVKITMSIYKMKTLEGGSRNFHSLNGNTRN